MSWSCLVGRLTAPPRRLMLFWWLSGGSQMAALTWGLPPFLVLLGLTLPFLTFHLLSVWAEGSLFTLHVLCVCKLPIVSAMLGELLEHWQFCICCPLGVVLVCFLVCCYASGNSIDPSELFQCLTCVACMHAQAKSRGALSGEVLTGSARELDRKHRSNMHKLPLLGLMLWDALVFVFFLIIVSSVLLLLLEEVIVIVVICFSLVYLVVLAIGINYSAWCRPLVRHCSSHLFCRCHYCVAVVSSSQSFFAWFVKVYIIQLAVLYALFSALPLSDMFRIFCRSCLLPLPSLRCLLF